MKKIGIVTIIDNHNFGNRLQNYATYYIFKRHYGINAVTLASHCDSRVDHGALIPGLKDSAVVVLSHVHGFVEKRFSPRVNRWVSFVKWSQRIPVKHYYDSYDLPEKVGTQFDYLFAGSDQIWNYSFSSERFQNYFLQFAAPQKRAAISASFGIEEIPEEWMQQYTEGLSGMKHISVREDAGARIVKELTGREVPVLIDPVMMLDREEWLAVAEKPRVDLSKPYVLKYYLGDKDDKRIDLWAEKNGYRIYELMREEDPDLYSAGPGEFLTLIDNAALVCSDSFHCIALSILLKRPFIVYARKGSLDNISSRMDTLLGKFDFQDRWDTCLKEEEYLNCDYSRLDKKLAAERKRFLAYVSAVLEEKDASVPYLADRRNCTGCTACANSCPLHCITMKPDENGFRYPVIDTKACIHCNTCVRTCPVLNDSVNKEGRPEAYAAYSLDGTLRMKSSSGGIFSEIAKIVLAKGGAVYGAAYDEHFHIRHIAVENLEDLDALRGAKYAESRLGKTFSDIKKRLDRGQDVLFSGTPCQVGGLKAYLNQEYSNLLCVDFVCHGVPSPMVWARYVKYRARTDNGGTSPITINLRDKSSGWSRYRYSNTFEYAGGTVHKELSTESVYMKLFTRDYISRPSCENCSFKGYSRSSDITLGDFWGIWDVSPEMDDDKGTSVILIQSEKGKEVWEELKPNILFKEVSLEQASRQNPSMISSSNQHSFRRTVLKDLHEGRFKKVSMLLSSPITKLRGNRTLDNRTV